MACDADAFVWLSISELHLRRSLKGCVIEETPTTPELDLAAQVFSFLQLHYSEEVQNQSKYAIRLWKIKTAFCYISATVCLVELENIPIVQIGP